jgi:hypothetical protein
MSEAGGCSRRDISGAWFGVTGLVGEVRGDGKPGRGRAWQGEGLAPVARTW